MKIFIYGTLKKRHCRSGIMRGEFLGEAKTTANYKMYSCGAYPALVEDKNGIEIEGELWDVDESLLLNLDQIEGVPYLYDRKSVRLSTHDFKDVITYLFQQSVDNLLECGSKWIGKK